MQRYEIINHLINLYNYKNYLEIGVNEGKNFKNIKIGDKEGVDPAGNCKFVMTSDDFFKTNKKIYDIIFIDGLHLDDQVVRDVENSLKFLNSNGMIVMHDCYPRRERHQTEVPPEHGAWTGTVWKAFAKLRASRPDLHMECVNTDHGVGLVKRGGQETLKLDPNKLSYQFFRKKKRKILNLISVEEFLKKFK